MTKWERVTAAKAGDKRWCTACGEDRVDRRSPNGWCPTCRVSLQKIRKREWHRKWRADNPEKAKEQGRAYNPDKERKWRLKRQLAYPDMVRERRNKAMRKWRATHREAREKQARAMQKWRADNPELSRQRDRERRSGNEVYQQRARERYAKKRLDAKLGAPLPDAAAVDWGSDIELEGDDDGRR